MFQKEKKMDFVVEVSFLKYPFFFLRDKKGRKQRVSNATPIVLLLLPFSCLLHILSLTLPRDHPCFVSFPGFHSRYENENVQNA